MSKRELEPQPKHAKRRMLEDFCDNTALPIGIITGGIVGLIIVAAVFNY